MSFKNFRIFILFFLQSRHGGELSLQSLGLAAQSNVSTTITFYWCEVDIYLKKTLTQSLQFV